MSRSLIVDASVAFKWFVEEEGAEIVPMRHLVGPAWRLAVGLRHPVYDGLYVALAMDRDATIVTADERFVALVRATRLTERVILLDEVHRLLD